MGFGTVKQVLLVVITVNLLEIGVWAHDATSHSGIERPQQTAGELNNAQMGGGLRPRQGRRTASGQKPTAGDEGKQRVLEEEKDYLLRLLESESNSVLPASTPRPTVASPVVSPTMMTPVVPQVPAPTSAPPAPRPTASRPIASPTMMTATTPPVTAPPLPAPTVSTTPPAPSPNAGPTKPPVPAQTPRPTRAPISSPLTSRYSSYPTEDPYPDPFECPVRVRVSCSTIDGVTPCLSLPIPEDPTSPECVVPVEYMYNMTNFGTDTRRIYSLTVLRNGVLTIVTNIPEEVPIVLVQPGQSYLAYSPQVVTADICTEQGLHVFDSKVDIAGGVPVESTVRRMATPEIE